MRRAARRDANEPEIINALRAIPGVCVEQLNSKGIPDLLVGAGGNNLLLEVKDGSLAPSARKLTEDQEIWHGKWTGQKAIVMNVDEAIEAVMEMLG